MSKKLGLDAAYKGLNLTTSVNKNSVLNKINLSGSTGMKAYDSTKMLTNSIALGVKKPSQLTFGKKALSIGKKVLGRTPIGRAVNAAVNIGAGIGVGYGIAKEKFNKKDVDKKMGGGMMQGYGAARTSGMGLEDQSLPPGKMVRASIGLLAMKKAKDKGAKGPELLSPIAMAGRFFNKGKMAKVKKAALTATALLGANYVGKRSGEKAVIDSINSGQAFKPEGAKMSLFGASLKRSKGGKMVKAGLGTFIKDMFGQKQKTASVSPTTDALTGDQNMEVRKIIMNKFRNKMGAKKGKMMKK